MPTPSDATAVPERSHDEMVRQAEDAISEQNRAIERRKTDFEQLQQSGDSQPGRSSGTGRLP